MKFNKNIYELGWEVPSLDSEKKKTVYIKKSDYCVLEKQFSIPRVAELMFDELLFEVLLQKHLKNFQIFIKFSTVANFQDDVCVSRSLSV